MILVSVDGDATLLLCGGIMILVAIDGDGDATLLVQIVHFFEKATHAILLLV